MPPFGPISRRDLIYYLRKAGFIGPYSGGKHQYMQKGDITIVMPNPHHADISRDLLSKIMKQAGISKKEWNLL